MSTLREAAQQALEALWFANAQHWFGSQTIERAISSLQAALAQQEPVTWGVDWGRDGDRSCCTIIKRHADGTQEVVAVEYAPPRREWVSLTEEEVWSQYQTLWPLPAAGDIVKFARAIEQVLRSKNDAVR
jgi:phage terminase large subunit-like protein